MTEKNHWFRIKKWLTGRSKEPHQNTSDREKSDLLDESEAHHSPSKTDKYAAGQNSSVIVKKIDKPQKLDNIEMLNNAFNALVDKLQGINDHLDKQVTQHEVLMQRIEKLPDLLESLPQSMENQKHLVNSLVDEMKTRSLKDQRLAETIERIPVETAKQTNTLIDMNQKLSVAAEADTQMAENFNRFNDTLKKIDNDTVDQTKGIMQMNKTFQAGDRYLKYIIYRQNKRFIWIFTIAIVICSFAILGLLISILLILNK